MAHNSISQRLHEDLALIINSTNPGGRLPSEPELAKKLGVSRATLREGMRIFETQGLLTRKQGAGTFVTRPNFILDSGVEVLESIESMARRIGLVVTLGEWKMERRPSDSKEQEVMGLNEGDQVLYISRVILAENRPVAFLIDTLPAALFEPGELEKSFSGSVLDFLLQRGRPPLKISRTDINAVTATNEIARAFNIQRGDVLLRFIAYLYSNLGNVVDYSFSYFLPGYFHFHVVRRVG